MVQGRALVVGKRGESADQARGHLGSNFERVVRAAKLPVLMAPRQMPEIREPTTRLRMRERPYAPMGLPYGTVAGVNGGNLGALPTVGPAWVPRRSFPEEDVDREVAIALCLQCLRCGTKLPRLRKRWQQRQRPCHRSTSGDRALIASGTPHLVSAGYSAVQPPSTMRAEPVVSAEASDARKTAAPTMSCTWPTRPNLILPITSWWNATSVK